MICCPVPAPAVRDGVVGLVGWYWTFEGGFARTDVVGECGLEDCRAGSGIVISGGGWVVEVLRADGCVEGGRPGLMVDIRGLGAVVYRAILKKTKTYILVFISWTCQAKQM